MENETILRENRDLLISVPKYGMILKKFRLKEKEVKKVLSRGRPFFSYNIVLNVIQNNCRNHRFSIVIGSKSVHNSVERNFFRRKFYEIIKENYLNIFFLSNKQIDLVFVVKKQTKLDKKDEKSIKEFRRDINFLMKKVSSI